MKTIIFPNNLTCWQKEFLTAIGSGESAFRGQINPVLVISPRQCFKSSTIALLMIKASLELVGDSVYISLTIQQARSQMQDTERLMSGSGVIKSINYQTLELSFINGSRIFFRSANQKDSLRGLTAENCLCLDECCWMDTDFILTALPLRRVKKALTIYISSPFVAEGMIWDLYNDPNTRLFDWSKYIDLIYTKEELEALKKRYTPFRYLTEILGRWAPSGSGLYFRKIKEAILTEEASKESIWIGVDCSSSENGDLTVVSAFNEKNEQVALFTENQLSPVDRIKWIADRIRFISKSGNIRQITVETNSMGMTYKDLLQRELNTKITGWVTSNKSKRDIIEHLQQLLENEQVKFLNDSGMIRELQSFECTIHKNGLITYSGKNCTDDRVMASAIALWSIKKSFGNYNIK